MTLGAPTRVYAEKGGTRAHPSAESLTRCWTETRAGLGLDRKFRDCQVHNTEAADDGSLTYLLSGTT